MTFVAGAVLTASQVNTYLMKQAVDICTSSTRPSSPAEGQVIYETDTDRLLTYTTAGTGWVQPWNMPWGRIGHAASSGTDFTGWSGTSYVDVTGVTLSFTAVANRYYVAKSKAGIYFTTTTGVAGARVVDGAGSVLGDSGWLGTPAAATSGYRLSVGIESNPFTFAAGPQTVKLQMAPLSGTGLTVENSQENATIWLEDVGPSAAPA
jgi:hypothetical protein